MAGSGTTSTDGDDALAQAVGRRVAELRGAKSAAEFAARVGISVAYLWRIEAGRQNLSLRNLGRIATALNVTLSELFEGVSAAGSALENRSYSRRDGDGAR